MVIEVIFDKRGNVEIAVVVSLVSVQGDGHARFTAGGHQLFRLQLAVLQKLIRLTLKTHE